MIKDGRTTWVYWLLDPRVGARGEIFYVGISLHPWWRFEQHKRNPCSAAWPRIREIEEDGFVCEFEALAEFSDRNDALELEHELIRRLPGLLNQDRKLRRMFDYEAAA